MDNNNPYPLTIIADRYMGTYSGGMYVAFPLDAKEIPEGPDQSDIECMNFWDDYEDPYGIGKTPNEALQNLVINIMERERGL